jgi:hypothetical protein
MPCLRKDSCSSAATGSPPATCSATAHPSQPLPNRSRSSAMVERPVLIVKVGLNRGGPELCVGEEVDELEDVEKKVLVTSLVIPL